MSKCQNVERQPWGTVSESLSFVRHCWEAAVEDLKYNKEGLCICVHGYASGLHGMLIESAASGALINGVSSSWIQLRLGPRILISPPDKNNLHLSPAICHAVYYFFDILSWIHTLSWGSLSHTDNKLIPLVQDRYTSATTVGCICSHPLWVFLNHERSTLIDFQFKTKDLVFVKNWRDKYMYSHLAQVLLQAFNYSLIQFILVQNT